MLESYFNNRWITYGPSETKLERGTPQGSVIGPTLWNIGYNVILKELQKRWTAYYAYADNTLLLLCSNNMKELERKINYKITNVQKTLQQEVGVGINKDKTEVLLFQPRPGTTDDERKFSPAFG
jgi:hypothetical protein